MPRGYNPVTTIGLLRVLLALGGAGAGACADGGATTDSASTTGTTHDPTNHDTTTPTTPTGGETGKQPLSPEGRWVLRDKDGARVQALVEPRCGSEPVDLPLSRCLPLEFGSPNSFPCARIIDHEGRFVNLLYDLETGEIGPCAYQGALGLGSTNRPWSEIQGSSFTNGQCLGTAYTNIYNALGSADFTKERLLFFAASDMWFVSEEGCLEAEFWWFNQDACVGPTSSRLLCPLVVVPDWLKGLLPNPPYTMAVEYG